MAQGPVANHIAKEEDAGAFFDFSGAVLPLATHALKVPMPLRTVVAAHFGPGPGANANGIDFFEYGASRVWLVSCATNNVVTLVQKWPVSGRIVKFAGTYAPGGFTWKEIEEDAQ